MNRYERYKDSGIPWLGEVPEHWDKIAIHYLVNLKSGDSITALDLVENGEYPVFGGGGFRGYINSFTHSGQFNLIGRQGALCGNVTLANGKFFATEHAIVVTPIKKLDTKWLYYLLITMNLNQYSTSAAQPGISAEVIGRLRVPFPNFKEQTAIAHYLDTKLGEIDALIDKQQTLLEKLAEQRTAVITHAVTKGLDPSAPMKKSGVEWLGDVPAHWSIIQFRRVVENIKDGTHGTHSRENNGFPLLSAKNVFNDGIHIHDNESQISEEDYKLITSNGFPKKNDLLITCVGSIGRCCIYPFDTPFAFQRSVAFLRLNKNAVPQFYKYFVESTCYQEQLKANVKLSIQGGVYLGTLISMYAILPTKEEQTSIAGYLNQETAKIDRLCETVNQTIGRLKEYRTALITQAVTGKIKVTDE